MKKILSIMIVSLLAIACTAACLLVLADTGLQESGEPSAETLSAEELPMEISTEPKTTLTTEEVLAAIERAEAAVGEAKALTQQAYYDYYEEVVFLAYTQLAQHMEDGLCMPFDETAAEGYSSMNNLVGVYFIFSGVDTSKAFSADDLIGGYLEKNLPGVTVFHFHSALGMVVRIEDGEATVLYPTAEQQAFLNSLPTEAELFGVSRETE